MNDVISSILKYNKIGITFHMSPDGDASGSALALLLGLLKLNKEVYLITKEDISNELSFLPYENLKIETNGIVTDDTECVIVVDCGSFERVSAFISDIRSFELINIDHHKTNDYYGDINLVDDSAACTGEIIYDILTTLKVEVDKDIAKCLYTSIITDTGSFKYPSTTKRTHIVAAEVISTGIDFNAIHKVLFENKKYERIKLYGEVINTMTLNCKNKFCAMEITQQTLKKLNLPENVDTSDIIAFAMQIDCIDVAAIFKETTNGIKISLRSKSIVDVSAIAQAFGGGGHIRAAGLVINKSMETAKKSVIKLIENELV